MGGEASRRRSRGEGCAGRKRSARPRCGGCLGGPGHRRDAPAAARDAWRRNAKRDGRGLPATLPLPVTVDDEDGHDVRADVPVSFAPRERGFTTRRVRQDWVLVPTGHDPADGEGPLHDPFALLGW